MGSLILGTAGHIDHGKTALVKALTGTDTDRLVEEKERGITIELGFAELAAEGGPRFGVVDVPGHEAFVRAMVAGAAGMDVVLLVVAADEGVMPQTREHLAIAELLAVPELVVALTKCDLVEAEWIELVEAEVAETLALTSFAGAPCVRTSSATGTGLDELVEALRRASDRVGGEATPDLARLPLDRVFTIQGTGTVVTGTLWSGSLATGDRVRVLPGDLEARIRGLQVHGRSADRAVAGERTAVALTGAGADRAAVTRGSTLVTDPAWQATWMLTVRARLLGDTAWSLEHNQRVHVHLATSEVLARVALLEPAGLAAGDQGWVQLRLEAPLVARTGDRVVLRAYSPVTTIGGGVVAECLPPKRTRIGPSERAALDRVLDGEPGDVLEACLALAEWQGMPRAELAIRTGLDSATVESALEALGSERCIDAGTTLFGADVGQRARDDILRAIEAAHARDPLLESIPLAAARAGLPGWAPPELADVVIGRLVEEGAVELAEGAVRRVGHDAKPTDEQERASREILAIFTNGGLGPPMLDEFPEPLRDRGDFRPLVRRLEKLGAVRMVADGLYVETGALDTAQERIRTELGGREGLGPSDFREVLPVTRKHLIPLLNHFDGVGVTVRRSEGRDVPTT